MSGLSNANKEPEIKVEDVMSSPVIMIRDSDNAAQASRLMMKHEIGCVVVQDGRGNPVGLITERDIVERVAAKNLTPSKVKVTKVMSKPLIAVGPNLAIKEAAKKMNKSHVRRLAVIQDGKLTGIMTSRDIIAVTPALIDVIVEKSRIGPISPVREQSVLIGYCDKCSVWSEHLRPYEGSFLCQDCTADLE